MKMLPVSHKTTKTPSQIPSGSLAIHPICDDPGATDDQGSWEGHLRSHEVKIRFFANN